MGDHPGGKARPQEERRIGGQHVGWLVVDLYTEVSEQHVPHFSGWIGRFALS